MTAGTLIAGLGSAFVDLVAELTNDEFERFGLSCPRGCVQRISREELEHFRQQLGDRAIARHTGGSASNTLKAAAFLGADVRPLLLAGEDDNGRYFLNSLTARGMDTSCLKLLPAHATDVCLTLVTPDGERTMLPMLDAGAMMSESVFSLSALEGVTHLHFEGYCVRTPAALMAYARLARRQGANTSIDLGDTELIREYRPVFEQLLNENAVSWLFGNRKEFAEFTGRNSPEDAVKSAAERTSEGAICTDGANGAWHCLKGEEPHLTPAVPPDKIVDTIGAGDTFVGAFLAGRAQLLPLEECCRRAAQLAARVLSRCGAELN